jgi:hypothetical protein
MSIAATGCAPERDLKKPAPQKASLATRAVSPLVGLTPPTGAEEIFEGRVTERIDVPPYVYLEVADDRGDVERWVVVPNLEPAAEGDHVHVRSFGVKVGFVSKRLGREFDRLNFGTAKEVGAPLSAARADDVQSTSRRPQ